MSIWRFLKERMVVYGDKTALICGYKRMSYAELISTVEIGDNSCGSGIMVADNSDRFYNAIEILRILAAGNIAVPLNPEYGRTYCDRIYDVIGENAASNIDRDIAIIMFTSGSSGKPKGVMLSHENVISNINAIDKYFKINSTDSILIARPLMHAAVLTGEFFISLYKGLTIHFYPESFIPQRVIAYIKQQGITTFCATPTLLKLLCRTIRKDEALPLKNIAGSGECLPQETAVLIADTFPNTDIYHVYGLTEASPRVSYLPPDKFRNKPGSIGVPIDGVQMRIAADDGTEITNETPGRLWVNSPGLMRGYLGNKALTESKIKEGWPEKASWLDTGDIACMDKDGYYFILGRADNMIIRSGMNIYPEEVENILLRDVRIEKALCYAEQDALMGQRICVKLVGNISQTEADTLARETLPVFMRPGKIEIVADLERTASGKCCRTGTAGSVGRTAR